MPTVQGGSRMELSTKGTIQPVSSVHLQIISTKDSDCFTERPEKKPSSSKSRRDRKNDCPQNRHQRGDGAEAGSESVANDPDMMIVDDENRRNSNEESSKLTDNDNSKRDESSSSRNQSTSPYLKVIQVEHVQDKRQGILVLYEDALADYKDYLQVNKTYKFKLLYRFWPEYSGTEPTKTFHYLGNSIKSSIVPKRGQQVLPVSQTLTSNKPAEKAATICHLSNPTTIDSLKDCRHQAPDGQQGVNKSSKSTNSINSSVSSSSCSGSSLTSVNAGAKIQNVVTKSSTSQQVQTASWTVLPVCSSKCVSNCNSTFAEYNYPISKVKTVRQARAAVAVSTDVESRQSENDKDERDGVAGTIRDVNHGAEDVYNNSTY